MNMSGPQMLDDFMVIFTLDSDTLYLPLLWEVSWASEFGDTGVQLGDKQHAE